jgi:hypothetical protein
MNADLLWAMEWLDTLSDCCGEHHMVGEFLADLEVQRKKSEALDRVAKEVQR